MKISKKIIKNTFVQKILSYIAIIYILFVKNTSSSNFHNLNIPKKFWENNEPFILAFWHSQLMMIGYSWKTRKKIYVLASGHSDGRFGSLVGKFFNLNNISTYKGKNKNILRPIFEIIKNKDFLGITPDGPRGPKENVSEGIIKIAKANKIPIIPFGYWSSKNFKLGSWDSFLITLPFSKCSFVWEDPIYITKDLDQDQIRSYQDLIKNKINNAILNAKKNIL